MFQQLPDSRVDKDHVEIAVHFDDGIHAGFRWPVCSRRQLYLKSIPHLISPGEI
jgi:hypothetical protein